MEIRRAYYFISANVKGCQGYSLKLLSLLGRAMDIRSVNQAIIGSDNDLLLIQRQSIS